MCLFSARYVEGAFVVRLWGQPKLAGLSKHGRVPYTYRIRVLKTVGQITSSEDHWENHMFVLSGSGAGLDFRQRITSTKSFCKLGENSV